MEKKQKVLQVYGIIVCVIAVITFIVCLSILVSSLINRSEPLYSGYSQKDLSSFESYKVEVMKSIKKDQVYIPNDSTILQMYEAAKNEKINKVLHQTKTSIIVTSLLILISIILFVIHWLMIKKYSRTEEIPIDASSRA